MALAVDELRSRISAFSHRVEARSDLLNKSVLLHTHYMELTDWYQQMDAKQPEYEMAAASVEQCERKKELWMVETDATAQACQSREGRGEYEIDGYGI